MLKMDVGPARPGILFSAVNGGSGKTFITTGIVAALSARGLAVQTFKKGPDYIDAKWLSLASGRKCYNLDIHLFKDHVLNSLVQKSADADISIIEGNHGLYDSVDPEGSGSSAFLARFTGMPVVLIVNCHKMSRSVAAIINGFVNFERDTNIVGVILNRVSGKRHEEKIVESIKRHCAVGVFGVVYQSNLANLEQRHLGIVTTEDKPDAKDMVTRLQDIAEKSIRLDKIIEAAALARPLPEHSLSVTADNFKKKKNNCVVIAVARDAAFNFYYPENIEALENDGAQLVYFSPVNDAVVPQADGIYIGGGYPEIYARELAENLAMKKNIADLIENGLPVFAECGGLMYLTEKITWNAAQHDMVGVIKAECVMHKKPQGKGYVELEARDLERKARPKKLETRDIKLETGDSSPWKIPPGITRAHEFHYSAIQGISADVDYIFTMKRGTGIINGRDGILYKNLVATYSHFHALAAPWWSHAFVNACDLFKKGQACPSQRLPAAN
jgi:cobyrinic acid a,c-diamide synthase